jgi:hypothetical protein
VVWVIEIEGNVFICSHRLMYDIVQCANLALSNHGSCYSSLLPLANGIGSSFIDTDIPMASKLVMTASIWPLVHTVVKVTL